MKMLVRALRDERGWSQETLAAAAEVRPATISDIENGKNAKLDTLIKVAAAFNVHVLDLFEDDRDDPETRDLISRVRRLDQDEQKGLAAILPRKPSE